tara:strand:- start:373 stop:1017 length:645 start_codon:yes stop_codon:yes gene_type:complete
MKANEMLNQIKTLLDIQVKLETMKLENGTDIEAEAFEKGKEVFILTDDEKVAMPVGEYILADSRLLVVEEEGMIADVREVSDEVPAKEEITSDLAEEKPTEKPTEKTEDLAEDTDEKKMADVADWEGMEKRIQNLEDAIADLKKDKISAEEVEEMGYGKKEEMNKDLKEELSQPAAQAIKHSPESIINKTEKVTFQKQRTRSIMDSVLSKIINN